MVARLDVITVGYADDHVASTCTLLRDGEVIAVVDPGMVARREQLTDPLHALGIEPGDVTDIVLSHHHPDHTMNVALFPNARVHDFMATYEADVWTDHEPGDFVLSESIVVTSTPGHTEQDVTTLVTTADGLVALTHLWWSAEGPQDDPFAPDQELLSQSRRRILELGPVRIIPGHGAPFEPSDATPR